VNHTLEAVLAPWLTAVLVGVGTAVVLIVGRWLAMALITRMVAPRQSDSESLVIVRSIHPWFLAVIGLSAAAPLSPVHLGTWFKDVLVVAAALQCLVTGSRVLNIVVARFLVSKGAFGSAAQTLLDALLKVALWTVVLLLMLENLGVKITTLLAGLGVAGIAIGLALQGVASDLFASLSIMLDKPFEVGDAITVNSLSGTVEKIGIKSTRLRSVTGEELIVPNTTLTTGNIQNFTDVKERRVLVTLAVTYNTPASTMRDIPQLIQQIVEKAPHARFDHCFFRDFGASSMDFELLWHAADADYGTFLKTQEAINLDILEMFNRRGIAFAYPTQTVILDSHAASPAGEEQQREESHEGHE
jgi:small-conductance mechanosensitive channel